MLTEILEASCWGLNCLPEGNVEVLALVPVYVCYVYMYVKVAQLCSAL